MAPEKHPAPGAQAAWWHLQRVRSLECRVQAEGRPGGDAQAGPCPDLVFCVSLIFRFIFLVFYFYCLLLEYQSATYWRLRKWVLPHRQFEKPWSRLAVGAGWGWHHSLCWMWVIGRQAVWAGLQRDQRHSGPPEGGAASSWGGDDLGGVGGSHVCRSLGQDWGTGQWGRGRGECQWYCGYRDGAQTSTDWGLEKLGVMSLLAKFRAFEGAPSISPLCMSMSRGLPAPRAALQRLAVPFSCGGRWHTPSSGLPCSVLALRPAASNDLLWPEVTGLSEALVNSDSCWGLAGSLSRRCLCGQSDVACVQRRHTPLLACQRGSPGWLLGWFQDLAQSEGKSWALATSSEHWGSTGTDVTCVTTMLRECPRVWGRSGVPQNLQWGAQGLWWWSLSPSSSAHACVSPQCSPSRPSLWPPAPGTYTQRQGSPGDGWGSSADHWGRSPGLSCGWRSLAGWVGVLSWSCFWATESVSSRVLWWL